MAKIARYTIKETPLAASVGVSVASGTVTTGSVPAQVTGLAEVSTTSGSVTASWIAAAGADTYNVYVDSTTVKTLTGVTSLSATVTGLTAETGYAIRVSASNDTGEGALSDPVTMTTSAVTTAAIYPQSPISGNILYVTTTGSTSQDRSTGLNDESKPFSLARALSVYDPGDVVLVRDGTYYGAENRWGAKIDAGYTNAAGFIFYSVNWVEVEGLEFTRGDAQGLRCNAGTPGASYITIRGCWIHHNADHNDSTDNLGGGNVGMYVGQYQRHWLIENNYIHSNGRLHPAYFEWNTYNHDHGLYIQGFGHRVQNNIVFDHISGWDIKVDHYTLLRSDEVGTKYDNAGDFTVPADERHGIYINNTLGSSNSVRQGNFNLYRNRATIRPTNVLLLNNIGWGNSTEFEYYAGNIGGALAESGSTGNWPGLEFVKNITRADKLVHWRTAGDDSYIDNNEDNITNLTNPGITGTDLGLSAPSHGERHVHIDGAVTPASEDAWAPTSAATLIVAQGKATHTWNGMPVIDAPAYDFYNRTRPATPSLGAIDYFGS